MATSKVKATCGAGWNVKEFDAFEQKVFTAAAQAGRQVPLPNDYLTTAQAVVDALKQQIGAIEAKVAAPAPAPAPAAAQINEDVLGPEVPLNRDVLGSDNEPRATQQANDAPPSQTDRPTTGGNAGTPDTRESVGVSTRAAGGETGSSVGQVVSDLKSFLRRGALGSRVVVVQTAADLPPGVKVSSKSRTQGVAIDDRNGGRAAYLIAGNIKPGRVRSVFMHEVGAHLGLDNLLTPSDYAQLIEQLKAWAEKGRAGSKKIEHVLALRAVNRVVDAKVKPEHRRSEMLAYFLEEAMDAGLGPSAVRGGPAAEFFQRVMNAFGRVLTLLGVAPGQLTAQDVVDLAYGAAQLEMDYTGPVPTVGDVKASANTSAFRRWFGNSKVVDADGRPLVVYHGTSENRDIEAFRATGENGDTLISNGGAGRGIYFSSGQNIPNMFARASEAKWGGAVYPVYLKISNMKTLEKGGEYGWGETFEDNLKKVWRDPTVDGIRYRARDDGADSSGDPDMDPYLDRAGEWVYVVKDPTQIKSAIGNNGNYDPANPDIRESVAPKTGIPSVDRAEGRINSVLQSLKDGASWTGIRAMFTEDLLNLAKKELPGGNVEKYQAAMSKIEVNKGRMERDVQKILQDFQTLPAHERGIGPGSVNALIMDSTVNRAWAFKPAWLDAKTPVDPAYAVRFNLLSPEGQALVKRVFEHGHTTLQQMQAAVRNNVTAEFDSEIAEAKAAGDAALVKKLTKKKDSELRDFKTLLDMGGGWPYAPLKRFGKYVVMGYSAQYQAAKDAGNVPEMQRLQKDGAHYHVAFAETQREARTLAAQLEPQFPGGAATHFEKLEGVEEFMGGRDVMGAFQRLRSVVADKAAGDDGKTDARLNNMMRQLYLTLLAEGSARKSELNRKTVAGANEDMMRAFATQGRATAHFIAGLQTNGSVNDALMAMKKEAGRTLAGRTEKQAYFNEILRRHSMNLEFTPTGLLDKVMAGTSIWMLLTNPSYFLLNMTQPYMMSSPLMGARYGYAKTHAAMFQAYREVAPTLKDAKFTEDDYSAMPPDVRQAIEELANQGVIDISLDSVLGGFESSSDKSAPGRALDYAVQRMRGAAQGVESLNRLATAIAAYRLAKERSGHDGAVKYAAQVIYETHGDYSGYNAPRFMRRGVGRLATQFRKFQLIQISMFARLLHTAFKDASKEERFVARKALAFNLAHLGAMGGLMGLPAFGAIAWMLGAIWPNDDEPDDPEATLRRLIGNNELADLLLKGAPKLLGVDVSGRIGAGGMLSLFPYTDLSATREGYANAMIALGGPFIGGLMPKVVDGLGLIASGEYWKGSEQLLPSGLGNVIRATRFNEEGVTRRNGDVVLSPDEINLLTWASQAVGLPSNTLSDRTFLANAQFKSDTFYRERTSTLKREYSEAVRNNDTAAMREAREDWLATQVARRELGFSVQPLSELLRAPREQLKRERSTIGGVQTRANNEGFVEALQ